MAKRIEVVTVGGSHIHNLYETCPVLVPKVMMMPPLGSDYPAVPRPHVYQVLGLKRGRARDDGIRRAPLGEVYPPLRSLSTLDELFTTLRGHVDSARVAELSELLQADFIEKINRYSEQSLHTDTPGEEQGCEYEKAKYTLRPNLEELLLKQPERFEGLLALARVHATHSAQLTSVLLQSLQHLRLSPGEAITFSTDLDLSNASFKGAELAETHFDGVITTGVDFSKADLRATTVTQEQLDASNTYEAAKIPASCLAYWNNQVRAKILNGFRDMRDYAVKRLNPADPKHVEIERLYAKYQPMLSGAETKITAEQKRKMLRELQAAKNGTLAAHRNLHYIFAEIISFIVSLGIGYVVAAAVNQQRTGSFGLFAETATGAKARVICDSIEEEAAVPLSALTA